jgi:hypothetical protein
MYISRNTKQFPKFVTRGKSSELDFIQCITVLSLMQFQLTLKKKHIALVQYSQEKRQQSTRLRGIKWPLFQHTRLQTQQLISQQFYESFSFTSHPGPIILHTTGFSLYYQKKTEKILIAETDKDIYGRGWRHPNYNKSFS